MTKTTQTNGRPAQGSPNQSAAAASTEDAKRVVGCCPFKHPDVALVPVRYALDEPFKAPEKQPHPLPNGHFKGPLNLTGNAYTLRQLRDGWLYVFDEKTKLLDEYEVKGTQFIHSTKGSKGHVLYPKAHTIALAFSSSRWSQRVQDAYSSQAALRQRYMRAFALSALASNLGGKHAGALDLLDTHVADVGLVNNGFTHSCTPLAPQEKSDSSLLCKDKPAVASTAFKAGLPDAKSTLVVALNDVIADMHDLTLYLNELWLQANDPFSDDTNRHRWLMAGITEHIGLPQVNESQLPKSVRGNRLATFRFKRKLYDYAVVKQRQQTFLNAPPVATSTSQMASMLSEKVATALAALEGYTPPATIAEQWGDERNRNAVNWSGLEAFLATHQPQLDALQLQTEHTFDDACLALSALPKEMLALGLDAENVDAYTYLITSCQSWVSTLNVTQPDSTRADKLTSILQQGALPALALYGFSEQNKTELEKDNAWINVSNLTASANFTAALAGFIDDNRIAGNKLYELMSVPARATLALLHEAVIGPAQQQWERLSMLLHPALHKGDKVGGWITATILESVHTGQSIKINPQFEDELALFLKQAKQNTWGKLQNSAGKPLPPQYIERLTNAATEMKQQKWPRLFLLEGKQALFEKKVRLYQVQLQQTRGDVATQAGKVWDDWGNWGGFAALLNSVNLVVTLAAYSENAAKNVGDPNAQKEQFRALFYTAAWQGNAVVSCYQGKAFSALSDDLLREKLKQASKSTLARNFVGMTAAMAGLGLLAALLEVKESWGKMRDRGNSDEETFGYELKALGIALQGAACISSLGFMLLDVTLSAIWAPWMALAMAIGATLYLVSTAILAVFSQTPMERWLRQSTWGSAPANWDAAKELEQYQRLAYAPKVSLTNDKTLQITVPQYVGEISVYMGVQRIRYQQSSSGTYASIPVLGPAQSFPIPKGLVLRQGAVELPHNLNIGDKFILLITYPLTESLSGKEQRFVLRGSIATGVTMTAEQGDGLPQKGESIKESLND